VEYQYKAQVIDSRHLKLMKPIKIAPGSTVLVTIEPAEGVAEAGEWYLLSAQGLENAYGEDEPEYSIKEIKVPNPEYQP
jgi:hypothetical protein